MEAPHTADLDLDRVDTREGLAELLRVLHARADRIPLRELERLTKHELAPLSRSTVSDMLNGHRFPRRAVLMAFVTACGVPSEEAAPWQRAWERVAETERRSAARVGPAAPPDARGEIADLLAAASREADAILASARTEAKRIIAEARRAAETEASRTAGTEASRAAGTEASRAAETEARQAVETDRRQTAEKEASRPAAATPYPRRPAVMTSREKGILEMLALIFDEQEKAQQFLIGIGFPVSRVAWFGDPEDFWGRVLREISFGISTDMTLGSLVRGARRQYPGNELFNSLRYIT